MILGPCYDGAAVRKREGSQLACAVREGGARYTHIRARRRNEAAVRAQAFLRPRPPPESAEAVGWCSGSRSSVRASGHPLHRPEQRRFDSHTPRPRG